jgi:hypothetical protein
MNPILMVPYKAAPFEQLNCASGKFIRRGAGRVEYRSGFSGCSYAEPIPVKFGAALAPLAACEPDAG